MKIEKRIARCRNRALKSFNPIWAYVFNVFSPFAVFTNMRTLFIVFREFFLLQFLEKLGLKKIPVVSVDHKLDEKIPFLPKKVSIYLDFINLWVRPLSMLAFRLGLVRGPKICKKWMLEFRKLYICAGKIYHFRLSTTNRPKYDEMREFRQIHALDPHFLCVPSLHIATVALVFGFYRRIFQEEGFTQDEVSRWLPELYGGAVEIAETVLYVKQHSVNCIPAALYMVVKNFGEYFGEDDARKFIFDMFKNPEGFSKDGADEVRAHIKNAFESYLEKCKSLKDDEWFLPVREFLENYGNL